MQFVCLDLEWNTGVIPQTGKHINEIIEIGAVRLDKALRETDRFQCFVRSVLTKELNGLVRKLTNITNEQMLSGKSFEKALGEFHDWLPDDCVVLTWSNTDLYTLADNCYSFLGGVSLPRLHWYVDLQRYAGDFLQVEKGRQISLSDAAIMLGIDVEALPLHRADEDSRLCAELLRRTYDETAFQPYIQNAVDPEFFRRLTFRPVMLTDPGDPEIDQRLLEVKCPSCDRKTARQGPWESYNKAITGVFQCPSCKRKYKLIARFKKHYDGVTVKRSVRLVPEPAGADSEKTPFARHTCSQT